MKPGNIDYHQSNGIIDGCTSDYYYNGYECETCSPFKEGINCEGGKIDQTSYPKRELISGYSFDNNTVSSCQDNYYRNGLKIIDNDETKIPCNQCPGGSYGNNGTNGPNTECILLPGYEWEYNKDTPNNYEIKLKDGNIDNFPYNGIIDKCSENYYYDGRECVTCGEDKGIDCTGGPIENAKKYIKPGYEIIEGFTSGSIERCGDNEYRYGNVEYNDDTVISCTECPIGSISNENHDGCILNNGYKWTDDGDSALNYNAILKPGYIDNPTDNPDGTIDGCDKGYYYNGSNCVECNYGDGVLCQRSNSLNEINRILQPHYSWNSDTQQAIKCEHTNNEYRLGEQEIQEDESIDCTECPMGTKRNSLDSENICKLKKGYSWQVNDEGNDIIISNDLYSVPVPSDAYTYDDIGNINGYSRGFYYNDGNCEKCEYDSGILCEGGPIDSAIRKLKPGYEWKNNDVNECPVGKYRNDEMTPVDNTTNIECNRTCEGGKKVNEDRTGCIDEDGYYYYSNNGQIDFVCASGYYYTENQNPLLKGECHKCSNDDHIVCNGGDVNLGNKGNRILLAGYDSNGKECNNGTYRSGDDILTSQPINCISCDYTSCGPNQYLYGCSGSSSGECTNCDDTTCASNEYLYGCGGSSKGECILCPYGQIRNKDSNECVDICSYNTYYDDRYCPDNSYYDEAIGLCVCDEGYKLNESGDGCVKILSYNDTCEPNADSDIPCNKCPKGYYRGAANEPNFKCQPETLSAHNRCSDPLIGRSDKNKKYPDCSKCNNGYYRSSSFFYSNRTYCNQ